MRKSSPIQETLQDPVSKQTKPPSITISHNKIWEREMGGDESLTSHPYVPPLPNLISVYIPGWLQTCNLLASVGMRVCVLPCWLRIILLLYSTRLRMPFISLIPIYLSTSIYFFLIETFGPTQLLPLHQIKLFVLLYTAKHPLPQRRKTGKDPRTIITYHPYNQ